MNNVYPQGTRSSDRTYDVALSFAGEDRKYVEEVARRLKARGLRVFYDRFDEVSAWGKGLPEHLEEIYKTESRFCVVFVSKHAKDKVWPEHERRVAEQRAIAQATEYILPARFDDTDISGITATVGQVDLRSMSLDEFVDLISRKVAIPVTGLLTKCAACVSVALVVSIAVVIFFLAHKVFIYPPTPATNTGDVFYEVIEESDHYRGPIDPDHIVLPFFTLAGLLAGLSLFRPDSPGNATLCIITGVLGGCIGGLIGVSLTRLFWHPENLFGDSVWYVRYWLAVCGAAVGAEFFLRDEYTLTLATGCLLGLVAGWFTAVLTVTPPGLGCITGSLSTAVLISLWHNYQSVLTRKSHIWSLTLLVVPLLIVVAIISSLNSRTLTEVLWMPIALAIGTTVTFVILKVGRLWLRFALSIAIGLMLAEIVSVAGNGVESSSLAIMAARGVFTGASLALGFGWCSPNRLLRVITRTGLVMMSCAWLWYCLSDDIGTIGAAPFVAMSLWTLSDKSPSKPYEEADRKVTAGPDK